MRKTTLCGQSSVGLKHLCDIDIFWHTLSWMTQNNLNIFPNRRHQETIFDGTTLFYTPKTSPERRSFLETIIFRFHDSGTFTNGLDGNTIATPGTGKLFLKQMLAKEISTHYPPKIQHSTAKSPFSTSNIYVCEMVDFSVLCLDSWRVSWNRRIELPQ